MKDNNSIIIMKKKMQRSVVEELFKKNIINFEMSNQIIKKIDSDILKLSNDEDEKEKKIIVEVEI